MMLDHLGERAAHDRILRAIEAVIADGSVRTPDLGGRATTEDIATGRRGAPMKLQRRPCNQESGIRTRIPDPWRKPDRQLDRRVLRMDAAVRRANDQRRLDPGPTRMPSGKSVARIIANNAMEALPLLEHHRTPADDDQGRARAAALRPSSLLLGEHTGENAARREVAAADEA